MVSGDESGDKGSEDSAVDKFEVGAEQGGVIKRVDPDPQVLK